MLRGEKSKGRMGGDSRQRVGGRERSGGGKGTS